MRTRPAGRDRWPGRWAAAADSAVCHLAEAALPTRFGEFRVAVF